MAHPERVGPCPEGKPPQAVRQAFGEPHPISALLLTR